MTVNSLPVRLVICVDGTWCKPDGVERTDTPTNIYRICASVKDGECKDITTGKPVLQKKIYVNGLGSADQPYSVQRLRAGIIGEGYRDQIREVYEECCKLTGPADEVWLFGFSRGAYVVRAVAGLLHIVKALKSAGNGLQFASDYKEMISVLKIMQRKANPEPAHVHHHFAQRTRDAPVVRFVGAFDTVKAVNDRSLFDISYNPSIMHMRHALALHEDREAFEPEYVYPEFHGINHRLPRDRSMVQAWFVGAHVDIGGSGPRAGLALYPLQWMLLECRSLGLYLEFDGDFGGRAKIENPLLTTNLEPENTDQQPHEWGYSTRNGVRVTMVDVRSITDSAVYAPRYAITIRRNRKLPWRRKVRAPFGSQGGERTLEGYCAFAPQGTIIHPSVYLLLDRYDNVYLETEALTLQRPLERWRYNTLGHREGQDQVVNQGFWDDGKLAEPEDLGAVRVLICGNTGVGKSTLINRVFGVEVTETADRTRGIHDVNKEIRFAGRDDLVVHDSGGFEAGGTEELEVIEQFLKHRSGATNIVDRLHVIWFCVEVATVRPSQTATEKLFRAVSRYAEDVPVILVATKTDDFIGIEYDQHRRALKRQGMQGNFEQECDDYAEAKLKERLDLLEAEMLSIDGGRLDACVGFARDDEESVQNLTRTTMHCFTSERVRLLYIRAQVADLDCKISLAIAKVMVIYRNVVLRSAVTGAAVPGFSTTNRLAGTLEVCKSILNCFGLPTVVPRTALEVYKSNIANDAGNNIVVALAEGIACAGVLGSLVTCTPLVLASYVNVPLVVPATARLLLCFSIDLILVLAKSFGEASKRYVGQPRLKDLTVAARAYHALSADVHHEVNRLIPRQNVIASWKTDQIQLRLQEIVEEYKPKVMHDIGSDPTAAFKNTSRFDRFGVSESSSVADTDSTYVGDAEDVHGALKTLERL